MGEPVSVANPATEKTNSHMNSCLLWINSKGCHGGRKKRLHPCRARTVYDSECPDAGYCVDSDPAEHDDAADAREDGNQVERASKPVGEEIGTKAPWQADAVHGEEQANRGPDLLGGSLGFRNTAHRTMVTPMTKPITLTVHPNLTFGRRDSAIAGYTRPPVAEPDAATPRASARFLRKYVEQIVMEGMKTSPLPRLTQMPCARKTCQYVMQSEVIKIPTSWIIMPMMKVRRKKPASVARLISRKPFCGALTGKRYGGYDSPFQSEYPDKVSPTR